MSNELLAEAQVEESAVEHSTIEQPKVGPQKKPKATGNLIADVAHEVENLKKSEARDLADTLAENIESNYFELGGVLKVIQEKGWWEPHPSFGAYVFEEFGYRKSKTNYLMAVYTHLVVKQIPWEKVGHLGWTKMKALAPVLTLENLDEWVARAEKATVLELQAMLHPKAEGVDSGTSSELVTLAFKPHADQLETMNAALDKAKTQFNTKSNSVAVEKISAAYLAAGADPVETAMKGLGWQKVLETVGQMAPDVLIAVSRADGQELPADWVAALPPSITVGLLPTDEHGS